MQTTPRALYSDLKERHVLITGGGAGIGKGIALAFAQQGSRVTILDRDTDKGAQVVEACRAQGAASAQLYAVDVTQTAALVETLARVKHEQGPVQVLIPNAGYDPRHDLLSLTEEEWDGLFHLNVRHYFIACREVIPDMIEAGSGSIIMTSSHLAWIAKTDMAAYNATKAAIIGLVRTLAGAYGKQGIRVNSVAPGWVMTERQLEQWVTPEAIEMTKNQLQALPIELQAEDMAQAFLFLASDVSRAFTRQTLVADAGFAQV